MGKNSWLKILSVVLSAGIVIISGLYIDLFYEFKEQSFELKKQGEELKALTVKYDQLAGLLELVNISIEKPPTHLASGIEIVSGYYLRPYIAFYSPLDNLTVKMYVFVDVLKREPLPLTIQEGNAFLNPSPVIWSLNASENRAYEAVLPSKGWYTLSMTGSIEKTDYGVKTHLLAQSNSWVDFRLLRNEKPVLFVIYRYGYQTS